MTSYPVHCSTVRAYAHAIALVHANEGRGQNIARRASSNPGQAPAECYLTFRPRSIEPTAER